MKCTISLGACAVAVLLAMPQLLAAEGERGPHRPPPERPAPMMMFDRLDKNHDGKITSEEASDNTLPRLKEVLVRADQNQDKTLTRDEFAAAMREHGFGPPGPEKPAVKPPLRPEQLASNLGPERRTPGPAWRPPQPPRRLSGHFGADWYRRGYWGGAAFFRSPMGPRHPRPYLPRPETVFKQLDRDGNQQLSLEEFRAGAMRMRLAMMHRGPRPAMAPPFLPPAMAHHPHKDQHSRHDREIIFERFKASDKNKDGKLSKEEAPEHLKRHFDAIDADHDGQLTSGELKRSVELLRERHAPEKRQKSDERKKSDKRKK